MLRAPSSILALVWTAVGCLAAAVGVASWLGWPTLKPEFATLGSQTVQGPSFGTASRKADHATTNLEDLPTTNGDLLALLQSSAGDLSSLKVNAALNYLKTPQRSETAMDPAAEYFNNIISLLLKQSDFSSNLSKTLLGVVNDDSQSLLLRDYAMQHFFHCWNRETDMETRRALEQSLKSHFQDIKSLLQGVSLLTTSRFFEQGRPVKGPNGEKISPIGGDSVHDSLAISKPTTFTDAEFVTTALRVTTDLAAVPAARACAFNVLLNMEVRQVINQARQVLQAAATPDVVRCCALAVIGNFGDLATDRKNLDTIPIQPDFVRKAADLALKKLIQLSEAKP